jgi:MoaA/NifB/PqqE/SkfB family radical SAM enzyme
VPSALVATSRRTLRRAVRRARGLALRARHRTAGALTDFTSPDGGHQALIDRLGSFIAAVDRRTTAWRADRATDAELAADLLALCSAADDGKLWHRELGPRSYVDASLQAKLLRVLLERACPGSPLALARALVEEVPESRPCLLVLGDLLLEAGDADGAVDVARRALRVQAVCMTAQDLLMRAYRIKRDAGCDDPETSIVDFDLTDRFCHVPFTHLSTGVEGNAFVCSCPAWVPYSVGSIYDAESPEDVWNSAAATEVRRSILDGDYSYCSRTQCSFMLAQKLPHKDEIEDPILRRYIDEHETHVAEAPRMLELNHDPTCNLACPSCRTGIVAAPRSDRDRLERAAERVLLPLMRRSEGHIYISGGGEVLSSPHMRSILRRLNRREYPGLGVYLITNAQLFTPKRWAALPDLHEMLAVVSVSVDAARPATYENLRRPGTWRALLRNLEYIGELRRANLIPAFELNFVVQRDNFREMLEFADLGEQVGADRLWFQRLVNYGSYDAPTFAQLDVASPRHPDHEELLALLRTPRLRSPAINMHMLLGLLPEFVASDAPLRLMT